ncbi:MAG: ribulose-phosphate 3-epimerase [Nanoarchaeota archaeon]
MIVSASFLSADLSHLQDAIDAIPAVEWLHVDVMDGHFVPNLTYGAAIMESIKTKKLFDVHLMVNEPELFIPWFRKAAYLTFHQEAAIKPDALIKEIKRQGSKAGISLKPDTPVSTLAPYLKDIDLVLVMSVEPGFAGQSFKQEALEKIKQLSAYRKQHKLKFLISVDGGVNDKNIKDVAEAGADVVVAANAVFQAKDPNAAVLRLKAS